ncbi:serine/threonine protein kinase [Anatilimnocola floriformis]|uniref:serine/threonine protein kinase n=1 Tax=Anatilimnocola floriformis TaxID=2948575 RepID=UPI0020C2CE72|nr:serine/threonine-protein kinase [Anatilimnocola floriformis]
MANVMPANAAQAFLDALATSQILNPESIAKIREQHAAAEDPKAVARDLIKEGKITKWQAGQLLHNFTALVVGNYKLLDQLGVGELGRVYLAEHMQMQRKAALKVLARKYTAQPQILRRILTEARRVASIEHPNVSHIHDVNQDGDRYFIVLEYVEAQDLQRQVQTSGKLPAAQAWNIIRQAAEGLAYAHAKGIVHGGLKPSNLLLDKNGNVKILDFALGQLASAVEPDKNDSVEQAAITAKLYRAPELKTGPADRAADVYSLGATLYFLLTGKAPLEGPASAAQLSKLAPETPAGIAQLCGQLMSAKPADRPHDDQALIAAIDAAQAPAAPAAKPAAKASATKTAAPAAKAPAAKAPAAKAKAEEPAAKAAPPKAKKPPVAKALPGDSQAVPVIAAADTEVEPTPSETPTEEAAADDNPFAGLAFQPATRRGTASKTPAAKAPAAKAPTKKEPAKKEPAKDAAKKDTAADAKPEPAKKGKKSSKGITKAQMPLIIGGGIGAGVLVLGGIIALVMYMMSGGNPKQIAKKEEAPAVVEAPVEQPAEAPADPAEANPAPAEEANPETPAPEANPAAPEAMPADPAKPEATEPPKPETPVAPPMPETKPEPKPEKPKAEPKPKPETKPAPPPKAPDPFVGFRTSVSLPKLPVGMTEPTPEMLAPITLGPCKIPDENTVISSMLKGGATAYAKGKMQFSMEPGNNGTSLRDWDFKLNTGVGNTITIATMSIKNDQLQFQWTAEGAKNGAAPYLCNCLISLSAGSGKVDFALREPAAAEAILIGIEKRTPTVKFNIDMPPEQKQLMFELVSVEAEVPKVKFDNKELIADKDTTFFWVGNVETETPVCVKIDTSVINSGKTVQVNVIPHFKLEPVAPKPTIFSKKEVAHVEGQIKNAMQSGQAMIQAAQGQKDAKEKQKMTQAANMTFEPAQKAYATFEQMINLAKSLDKGRIRYRIYAAADDAKVELYTTEASAAGQGNAPAGGKPANDKNAINNVPQLNLNNPAPPPANGKKPAGKAPDRPPLGTDEITAEAIGNEALQLDNAAFEAKHKGESFWIKGNVDSVVDSNVFLKVAAMKDGKSVKVILAFANAADARALAKSGEVVVACDFQSRAPGGPQFNNCEVIKK